MHPKSCDRKAIEKKKQPSSTVEVEGKDVCRVPVNSALPVGVDIRQLEGIDATDDNDEFVPSPFVLID